MSKIDWNAPFRPEDFHNTYTDLANETAAKDANRRFRELMAQAPIVYWNSLDFAYYSDPEHCTGPFKKGPTHQARLIAIEEIKK